MRHRGVEDPRPAVMHSGPTGTPASERCHPLILLSCAQEPLVDCLGAGSVSTYLGEQILPGTPLEILGARRDAAVAREAVRMAGRPGMHINDVAVPLTCAGKMSAFDPEAGLRRSDAILVAQMVELKTNFDQLSRVAHLYNLGAITVDLMTPLIGGIGGGAEGTAVVSVADHLLGAVLYDADYHMFSHTHIRFVNNTDPMGLWCQAVVGQALARNTGMITLNDIYTVSGPGTKELLYECAAGAVVGTVSGFNMQGAGTTGGFNRDHTTGLEARFIAEVSRAALGLSRQAASALAGELLHRYEASLARPPHHKRRERDLAIMESLSRRAFDEYRKLVKAPGFVAYWRHSTPIAEISELNIGSRPASRKAGESIEDLRAIPWVFSWSQCRLMLPGWYGFGAAVEGWLEAREGTLEELREMHRAWPFWQTVLSNMDMVLAKTDLAIGSRYAELVPDAKLRDETFGRISQEWHRARRWLAAITGREELLADNPTLARSIRNRFPYLDPLNHLQVELLHRYRAGKDDRLLRIIHLTINGVAAGLRNSG